MSQVDTKQGNASPASERSNSASYEPKSVAIEKAGTVVSGYTVITKSMIGAGMFSMAAGCKNFGIIFGVFLLILAAAITWLSLKVLSYLALEHKESNPSFYSVSEKLIPKMKWLIDVALIINCFGGVIAYVQTFGNLLGSALVAIIGWDTIKFSRESAVLVIQASILLALAPLCMMKEISSTKIANMIGLGCILYIVVMTFFYTPCTLAGDSSLLGPGSALKAFGSFPTFIFAYACQQNVFTVSNEIKDVSMKKLDSISVSSVLTGFIIYLPLMILPFLTWGQNVEGTYLASMDSTKVPVQIAYIFASLSVSISYVLLLQPVRCSIFSLAFGTTQPTGNKERTIRIALVTVLMAASFGLAVALGKNLELPIGIAGLLGGNTMCFVAPFILYFRQYGFDRKNKFSLAVMATLVFCILLYPICMTGIIYSAVSR